MKKVKQLTLLTTALLTTFFVFATTFGGEVAHGQVIQEKNAITKNMSVQSKSTIKYGEMKRTLSKPVSKYHVSYLLKGGRYMGWLYLHKKWKEGNLWYASYSGTLKKVK
ncbi:hypothetical protein [Shouchella lonarensis]|uniref:Uncharacterized protein n=1 Tax=Shouchella lonarensis TaxID=1464122 RepID=A0A1G6J3V2_9BACI|nr:hypothetical protein [Shouchella lonarensis]SDC13283.1 hypothetical protein SAMN05421737_105243 [Shouchella lonarensis]